MTEPRLKAGVWVGMALRRGNSEGRYGVVLRHGDDDAGGILVVLRSTAPKRPSAFPRRSAMPTQIPALMRGWLICR